MKHTYGVEDRNTPWWRRLWWRLRHHHRCERCGTAESYPGALWATVWGHWMCWECAELAVKVGISRGWARVEHVERRKAS